MNPPIVCSAGQSAGGGALMWKNSESMGQPLGRQLGIQEWPAQVSMGVAHSNQRHQLRQGAATLRQMGWKAALEGLLADWCPRISTSRIVSSGLLQRRTEHVCYSCVCNGKQLMSIHRKVVINDASSPSDALQPLRRQA